MPTTSSPLPPAKTAADQADAKTPTIKNTSSLVTSQEEELEEIIRSIKNLDKSFNTIHKRLDVDADDATATHSLQSGLFSGVTGGVSGDSSNNKGGGGGGGGEENSVISGLTNVNEEEEYGDDEDEESVGKIRQQNKMSQGILKREESAERKSGTANGVGGENDFLKGAIAGAFQNFSNDLTQKQDDEDDEEEGNVFARIEKMTESNTPTTTAAATTTSSEGKEKPQRRSILERSSSAISIPEGLDSTQATTTTTLPPLPSLSYPDNNKTPPTSTTNQQKDDNQTTTPFDFDQYTKSITNALQSIRSPFDDNTTTTTTTGNSQPSVSQEKEGRNTAMPEEQVVEVANRKLQKELSVTELIMRNEFRKEDDNNNVSVAQSKDGGAIGPLPPSQQQHQQQQQRLHDQQHVEEQNNEYLQLGNNGKIIHSPIRQQQQQQQHDQNSSLSINTTEMNQMNTQKDGGIQNTEAAAIFGHENTATTPAAAVTTTTVQNQNGALFDGGISDVGLLGFGISSPSSSPAPSSQAGEEKTNEEEEANQTALLEADACLFGYNINSNNNATNTNYNYAAGADGIANQQYQPQSQQQQSGSYNDSTDLLGFNTDNNNTTSFQYQQQQQQQQQHHDLENNSFSSSMAEGEGTSERENAKTSSHDALHADNPFHNSLQPKEEEKEQIETIEENEDVVFYQSTFATKVKNLMKIPSSTSSTTTPYSRAIDTEEDYNIDDNGDNYDDDDDDITMNTSSIVYNPNRHEYHAKDGGELAYRKTSISRDMASVLEQDRAATAREGKEDKMIMIHLGSCVIPLKKSFCIMTVLFVASLAIAIGLFGYVMRVNKDSSDNKDPSFNPNGAVVGETDEGVENDNENSPYLVSESFVQTFHGVDLSSMDIQQMHGFEAILANYTQYYKDSSSENGYDSGDKDEKLNRRRRIKEENKKTSSSPVVTTQCVFNNQVLSSWIRKRKHKFGAGDNVEENIPGNEILVEMPPDESAFYEEPTYTYIPSDEDNDLPPIYVPIESNNEENDNGRKLVEQDTVVNSLEVDFTMTYSSIEDITHENYPMKFDLYINGEEGKTRLLSDLRSLGLNVDEVDELFMRGEEGIPLVTRTLPPPTSVPSTAPTTSMGPSTHPSMYHSSPPSSHPTSTPSITPTEVHSFGPSAQHTEVPSLRPSLRPSSNLSHSPTAFHSANPSFYPSSHQSAEPSYTPSSAHSKYPSTIPTVFPTNVPSSGPTKSSTDPPTPSVDKNPTPAPTSRERSYCCVFAWWGHCYISCP